MPFITKARAAIGVGQGIVAWFSPTWVTSPFSSWIYIGCVALIWRVSDSPPTSTASHHPKHRANDFIDFTSE